MKKSIKLVIASFLFFSLFLVNSEPTHANSIGPKHEMRASWISTVVNIDLKAGMNEAQYREWAESTIKKLESKNFNAIVFQVKPTADALYPSELAPWSRYISGLGQGVDPGYDPLQIMLDTAHKYGLELHAWINPYRVTMASQGFDDLTDDNIAKKNPDWVVKYGSQLYLNPGLPEVQDYLIETAKELVTNYDVDAVHMDDYFYPGVDFDDSATFEEYGDGFENRGDWRRNNVNQLVKKLNDNIKKIKPWVQFGISPSGIWRNETEDPKGSATNGQGHYDALFADSQQWIQEGSLDYITPQIYWSRELAIASYSVLLDWWSKSVEQHPVNLYIGMADYKINNNFDTAWENVRELPEQIHANRNNKEALGQMHFTLRDINNNALGYSDIIDEELYNYKALTPTIPWNGSSIPNQPENVSLDDHNDGIEITIESAEANVRKFVVYRFDDKASVDYTNPKNVVGVVYKKQGFGSFIDRKLGLDESTIYGVTSVSQTGIESETGVEIRWPNVLASELEELVEKASEKNPEIYTEESWEILEAALENAQTVMEDPLATQQEVDNALSTLTEAIAQLKDLPVDKSDLEMLVNQASERQEAGYTRESWDIFNLALENAKTVIENENVSQEEVNAALLELTEGLAQLEDLPVDKSGLEALVNQANERQEADYTKVSWDIFNSALENARNVIQDRNATQKDVDAATLQLTEGMIQLKELSVDKSDLETLVNLANERQEADYTKESWNVFNSALENAQYVMENENATQEEVEDAMVNLTEGIIQLKELSIDKSDLEMLVNLANERNEVDYTKESWNVFDLALENAKDVIENENATQEEIENALSVLTEAIAQLKDIPVDKSDLETLVNQANERDEADYTKESWNVFNLALENAKSVIENENVSQEEVNAALLELTEGLAQLKDLPVDKAGLEALVNQANERNEANYTKESWDIFNSALENAHSVIQDKNATQKEVDDASLQLTEGMIQLKELSVDKSDLKSLVNLANERNAEDYTKESWTIFNSALENAQNVMENRNATQDEVNNALLELTDGLTQLAELLVDKSALELLVEQANDRRVENYTAESWKTYEIALEKALQALENDKATQQEVDKITDQLLVAIDQLKEKTKVVKEELESLIAQGDKKKEQDYTLESWKIFSAVLKNAKELLADESANQDDVNLMITNLKDALAQLVNKTEENGVGGGGNSANKPSNGDGISKPGNGESINKPGKGQSLPKTATNVFNVILFGSIILFLGFLLYFINRKRIKNMD